MKEKSLALIVGVFLVLSIPLANAFSPEFNEWIDELFSIPSSLMFSLTSGCSQVTDQLHKELWYTCNYDKCEVKAGHKIYLSEKPGVEWCLDIEAHHDGTKYYDEACWSGSWNYALTDYIWLDEGESLSDYSASITKNKDDVDPLITSRDSYLLVYGYDCPEPTTTTTSTTTTVPTTTTTTTSSTTTSTTTTTIPPANVIEVSRDIHVEGRRVVGDFKLKNKGGKTADDFLVEIQPRSGTCASNQLASVVIGSQDTCDPNKPNYVHRLIEDLGPGEYAEFTIETPPLSKGSYCIVGVSTDSCCTKPPGQPSCVAVDPYNWEGFYKDVEVTQTCDVHSDVDCEPDTWDEDARTCINDWTIDKCQDKTLYKSRDCENKYADCTCKIHTKHEETTETVECCTDADCPTGTCGTDYTCKGTLGGTLDLIFKGIMSILGI